METTMAISELRFEVWAYMQHILVNVGIWPECEIDDQLEATLTGFDAVCMRFGYAGKR
jgi:hypothetical protein